MPDGNSRKNRIGWRWRRLLRFDPLLLLFLLAGWSCIFLAGNLGLQQNRQQWLPVNLVAQVSADYRQDERQAAPLARLNPDIVEAVRQDAQVEQERAASTPVSSANETPPPPAPTPLVSPVPTSPAALLNVSAGGPYQGDEGSPVSLIAGDFQSVLRFVPGAVAYSWDLNGDEIYEDAKGVFTSVLFYDEGVYPVAVRAVDLFKRVAIARTTVTVRNRPPRVQIEPVQSVSEAEKIEFLATATDPGRRDVLFYQWDFGDGTSRVNGTLHPQHTYLDDGEYTVRVRVTDNDGGVGEDYFVVEVANLPPQVEAGPDQLVDEGQPVTFQAQATDPSDFDTLNYFWDLDFDGQTFSPDVTGPEASTTYADGPDEVMVALVVRDEDGGETLDTLKVAVNNSPPAIVSVSDDGAVGEGFPLTLVVEATDVVADVLTYAFDWDNDGLFDNVNQPDTVSYIWYQQGNHTIGIRVDDGDGSPVFTTTTVATFNLPPVAVANTVSVALEGDSITFDGSESTDPGINAADPADPANDRLTYQWDFGDGLTASGPVVNHGYANNRVYTGTLTVTDESGAANSTAFGLTILNANPRADAGSDRTVAEGVTTTYIGSAADPGTADQLSYAWDFDYDGLNFDVDATGPSVNWTYRDDRDDPEDFVVALRVRDSDYPYLTDAGGQIGETIDTLLVSVENSAPRVATGGPYRGLVGQTITLAGTADDVAADTLTYEWDLAYDGTTFQPDLGGQTASHNWTTGGLYNVALRVTDDDGGAGLAITTVDIDTVPIAVAGGPYSGVEGSLITVDATGSSDPDGDPLRYNWNFGDGSPVTTGLTATHVYATDGPYVAALEVDDGRGGRAVATATVTIANLPPVAVASASPASPLEGAAVTFNGDQSSDPGVADQLTYRWDFGDGSPAAAGVSVAHTYADNGVYTAILTVADDAGAESTASLVVSVQNVPPVADGGGPYATTLAVPVTLTGAGVDVPADLLSYAWDLDNDGLFETAGPVVTYIGLIAGSQTVTLRVTDDDGDSTLAVATVEVGSPPTAVSGGPYAGDEGSPITLSGSGLDPDGDPLVYTWDLDNDGVFETTGATTSNTWFDNGVYAVTLQVEDDRGGVATDSTTVTVNNLPPIAVAGLDQTGWVGEPVSFDGSGSSDPGAADTLSFEWDFGDGTPVVNGDRTTHSYNAAGNYTVTLTVTDDDGATAIDTVNVTIQ